MSENQLIGTLKVLEIEDLENGKCRIVFDVSDEFIKAFKEVYGYKRFTRQRFDKFVNEALEHAVKNYEVSYNDSNGKEGV